MPDLSSMWVCEHGVILQRCHCWWSVLLLPSEVWQVFLIVSPPLHLWETAPTLYVRRANAMWVASTGDKQSEHYAWESLRQAAEVVGLSLSVDVSGSSYLSCSQLYCIRCMLRPAMVVGCVAAWISTMRCNLLCSDCSA